MARPAEFCRSVGVCADLRKTENFTFVESTQLARSARRTDLFMCPQSADERLMKRNGNFLVFSFDGMNKKESRRQTALLPLPFAQSCLFIMFALGSTSPVSSMRFIAAASVSDFLRARAIISSASSGRTTTTPSASPTMMSPGLTRAPPISTTTFTRPSRTCRPRAERRRAQRLGRRFPRSLRCRGTPRR